MSRPKFNSIFANEINSYLDYKISAGYLEKSFCNHLRNFDRFCISHEVTKLLFTVELAEKWIKRNDNEATTTHYSRINGVKQFLIYLNRKGYDVFVTRDICFKPTDFQPYIYSDDEVIRYFFAGYEKRM
jgi:hypothetical protein